MVTENPENSSEATPEVNDAPLSVPPTEKVAVNEAEMLPPPPLPTFTPVVPTKPRRPKNTSYWGVTSMLVVGVILLAVQIVIGVILAFIVIFNEDFIDQFLSGTNVQIDEQAILAQMPWLILISQLLMYAVWLGGMWWVTFYRSNVKNGLVKFWTAFKKNFFLTSFKKRDIAYGVGLAAILYGAQLFFLNVLPSMFPSINMEGASNTGLFEELAFPWLIVIGLCVGGVIGPICEELFFRGFLLRGFINHFGYANHTRNVDDLEREVQNKLGTDFHSMIIAIRAWMHKSRYVLAVILSSVIFGFMHFQGFENFGQIVVILWTGLMGAVFAIVTLKLNRMWPAIFAHIVYNSTTFIILITMQ